MVIQPSKTGLEELKVVDKMVKKSKMILFSQNLSLYIFLLVDYGLGHFFVKMTLPNANTYSSELTCQKAY